MVLAVAALGLMAATPGFFTAGNLGTILALASIVGVLAVGQAFVLIGGGFDLSQGATIALTAAATAWLAGPSAVNAWMAAGAGLFPHVIGTDLIGFIEVNAKFLKAVYPGDTLYPLLEITGLERQRTTGIVRMKATIHNQDSVLVLEGAHAYLVKLG